MTKFIIKSARFYQKIESTGEMTYTAKHLSESTGNTHINSGFH